MSLPNGAGRSEMDRVLETPDMAKQQGILSPQQTTVPQNHCLTDFPDKTTV